jgi:hypothetical protein
MSILNNAVLSIQVGLEDFAAGTPGRLLSAVRNLHAGVLLMLKARLQSLCPPGSDDVLLKQRITPRLGATGQVEFVGSGGKTVDAHEIRQRLEALGVKVEWKRIQRLTDERNNIEHYYASVSNDAIRGLVSEVFVIIRDFAALELGQDPKVLLGEDAWTQLLENKEVFDREREDCIRSLRAVQWGSPTLAEAILELSCDACGSSLLRARDPAVTLDEMELVCRSCEAQITADEFIAAALEEHCGYEAFEAERHGGEDPLADCPGCLQRAFIVAEGGCARCGYELDYTNCIRCDAGLGPDEQDLGGLCGYCSHMCSKDD